MTTYKGVMTQAGFNALTETDRANIIFDSQYNTFKIVASGTVSFDIASGATTVGNITHGLSYIPTFNAFLRKSGASVVIGIGGAVYPSGVSNNTKYRFLTSYADSTKVYFSVQNTTGASITVVVKYYLFEAPL